jgi:hypothetical protein
MYRSIAFSFSSDFRKQLQIGMKVDQLLVFLVNTKNYVKKFTLYSTLNNLYLRHLKIRRNAGISR